MPMTYDIPLVTKNKDERRLIKHKKRRKKGGSKNKNKDLNKDISYLPDILIKIIVLYTHHNNIQL